MSKQKKSKVYVIVEGGWEYNDQNNYVSGHYSVNRVFLNKADAEKAAALGDIESFKCLCLDDLYNYCECIDEFTSLPISTLVAKIQDFGLEVDADFINDGHDLPHPTEDAPDEVWAEYRKLFDRLGALQWIIERDAE